MCDVKVDAIRFVVALGRPGIIICVGSGGGGSRLFGKVMEVMEVVVGGGGDNSQLFPLLKENPNPAHCSW